MSQVHQPVLAELSLKRTESERCLAHCALVERPKVRALCRIPKAGSILSEQFGQFVQFHAREPYQKCRPGKVRCGGCVGF